VLRDLLALREIYHLNRPAIETVREQQHAEIGGLYVAVQARFLNVDRAVSLDVDIQPAHMP